MPVIEKQKRRPWEAVREVQGGRKNPNKSFYWTAAWKRLRKIQLAQHPLCKFCLDKDKLTDAKIVDHIVPINKGGGQLDINNLQSLCTSCHNSKSARDK